MVSVSSSESATTFTHREILSQLIYTITEFEASLCNILELDASVKSQR